MKIHPPIRNVGWPGGAASATVSLNLFLLIAMTNLFHKYQLASSRTRAGQPIIANYRLLPFVIVITDYLPSCLGQKAAKGPFGLRVKLPPVYQTYCPFLLLNVKQGSCEYQFL